MSHWIDPPQLGDVAVVRYANSGTLAIAEYKLAPGIDYFWNPLEGQPCENQLRNNPVPVQLLTRIDLLEDQDGAPYPEEVQNLVRELTAGLQDEDEIQSWRNLVYAALDSVGRG